MTTISAFTSVPVIDISGLRSIDSEERAQVVDALRTAARDVGFFYIGGTGLDRTLFEDLLDMSKRFFALPTDEKMRYYIGLSKNHRGYVPTGEEGFDNGAAPDLKEAFDTALEVPADDPDHLGGNPLLGPNVWPEIDGFAEVVSSYYRAIDRLGRELLSAFAIGLGQDPDTFSRHATKPVSQLRMIHYWPDDNAVDAVGIGAHTDMECFTLLKPTAPGLEVMNGAGEWIDVPPIPDTLVVNIGDMLELWTNGQFVATTHRVRKVTDERYSFPFFFALDYDTVVEPLPEFADGGNHEKVVFGDHLYSMTMQSFHYLRERRRRGEIELPSGSYELDPDNPVPLFGQGARHTETAGVPS
ncbi:MULTISPECIES: isopenicillin N synthase family oxygenase [Nocardiaceae]|uniref:Isopenicillin N synthase-like dioxygenase n=1 Tax=Rhodococcoides corynebacterioides TaxID=53972 RepID=A0ABS2KYJ4_9NOCA|nr:MULTISPECIES: 2-oxoglutarate and iron-dependent oxygenase domain-containing protein [Rhodococcus]MBM7417013.1 isopenicillin N synthase-like dioxygenase [Rhodococcus corynebacterioides]MBP1115266.1 isopenicillin N synthase-like dioxygenase [Rhodococcus sp. PvP016]